MSNDLHSRVDHTEKELSLIRRDFAAVQAVVTQQSTALSALAEKIDDISKTFHKTMHTSLSEVAQILQVIVYCTAIIGAVVTGIVYVAGNSNSAEMAVARYRLERAERKIIDLTEVKK